MTALCDQFTIYKADRITQTFSALEAGMDPIPVDAILTSACSIYMSTFPLVYLKDVDKILRQVRPPPYVLDPWGSWLIKYAKE